MQMVEGQVVLPGDQFNTLSDEKAKELRLGPGLAYQNDQIVTLKAGILRHRSPETFWIDTSQKRYVPVQQEKVIGIVTNKSGDNFSVDVGASSQAMLSYLRFEGATKRNRPNVEIGDLVLARFILADKNKELELSCIDKGEKCNGLGKLENGFMFQLPLESVRRLTMGKSVIQLLGEKISFEVAIGMNGRIWLDSPSTILTINIVNFIRSCQYLTGEQIEKNLKKFIKNLPSLAD
ncbi:Exosome complex component RRP40 [Trichoplax sp. H2]|nr:Exosome complex component RRP40 [Trichoplax sp. H2]|eukprot:RDD40230.1 Exosome complex component RRP40 [Trichoplax sp. H2]